MNKRLFFWAKVVLLLMVAAGVAWQVNKSWREVGAVDVRIDWRWGILSVACFCANMITGGLVWRWLAWKMGDRGPTGRLLGAYTFSQMGKYIPGKVVLLLMRIERAGRWGMSAGVCMLSTLLENALFMVSGGLAGVVAIIQVAAGLDDRRRAIVWIGTIGGVVLLGAFCVPSVFYGLVNKLLRGMKKPAVAAEARLGAGTLVLAVVAFFPCWIFGGLALWGSVQAVQGVGLVENWWFAGAFALGVIVGMASLLPGGAGIRDAMLGVAVMIALRPVVGKDNAVILAGVVAILQRLFQIAAEVLMGLLGMWVSGGRRVAAGG